MPSEDRFRAWLLEHPECSRRQAFEHGIELALEELDEHAKDCGSEGCCCFRLEEALTGLVL